MAEVGADGEVEVDPETGNVEHARLDVVTTDATGRWVHIDVTVTDAATTNPEQLRRNAELSLFKSPNCVSVGTSIALKAISDAYGVTEASVCTFQSLSGRGDAMYPRDLVQGNVYPVWGTKEHTEQWIHNEVASLLHMAPGTLSVRANLSAFTSASSSTCGSRCATAKRCSSLQPKTST